MNDNIIVAPERFEIIYDHQTLHLGASTENAIAELWEQEKAKNKNVFNGAIYSITDIRFDGLSYRIIVTKSDYAHKLYSVRHIENTLTTNKNITRHMATSGLIITNDNYYCLGKMNTWTSFPDLVQCPGGSLDEGDIYGDQLNTWKSVCREVKEEVNLDISEMYTTKGLPCKYFIVRPNFSYLGFCYVLKPNMSKDEIVHQFAKDDDKTTNELSELIFVKRELDSIRDFFSTSRLKKVDYLENLLLTDIGYKKSTHWRSFYETQIVEIFQ